MKKKWLKSNSVCMAMGDAVALNLMFENKQDHELFFNLWKKYLGGMANLLNYHLSPTGWVLLFKTKPTKEIKSAYEDLRSQSKKAKHEHRYHDVSKMLSEHFRIFLSQFVKRSNAKHGRQGTKVKQRFHRYVFDVAADYATFFEKITRGLRVKSQNTKKYQADETGYDVENEILKNSVWKIGDSLYKGLERGFRKKYGVLLIRPNSYVLRKYLRDSKPINPMPPFS